MNKIVDQTGKRSHDQNINRFTVIANEVYNDFAKAYLFFLFF